VSGIESCLRHPGDRRPAEYPNVRGHDMPLHLSIDCHPYDRIAALMDGSVSVEGCSTSILPLGR
jgi:hypothetical protein